jgi:hypothetical protein
MADTDITAELPPGWLIYARETPEGEHWTGEHYGPHGFTTRLGDATRAGLVRKILARHAYRVADGHEDRPAVQSRTVA